MHAAHSDRCCDRRPLLLLPSSRRVHHSLRPHTRIAAIANNPSTHLRRALSSAATPAASASPAYTRPPAIPSSYTVQHSEQISPREQELTKDHPTPNIPTDKEWDAIIVGG